MWHDNSHFYNGPHYLIVSTEYLACVQQLVRATFTAHLRHAVLVDANHHHVLCYGA